MITVCRRKNTRLGSRDAIQAPLGVVPRIKLLLTWFRLRQTPRNGDTNQCDWLIRILLNLSTDLLLGLISLDAELRQTYSPLAAILGFLPPVSMLAEGFWNTCVN